MFAKPVRLIGLGVVLVLVVALLTSFQGAVPARAASPAQTAASTCNTCHESEYSLHDTGNWYCVVEASERCVNCHGGNAEALTEQEAHAGLVVNPLADGGTRCEACHAGETEAFVQQVSSRIEVHDVVQAEYNPHKVSDKGNTLSDEREASLWYIPGAALVFAFWAFLMLRSGRK